MISTLTPKLRPVQGYWWPMADTAQTYIRLLKQAAAAGLSSPEIARICGIENTSTVHRWITGERQPTKRNWAKIARLRQEIPSPAKDVEQDDPYRVGVIANTEALREYLRNQLYDQELTPTDLARRMHYDAVGPLKKLLEGKLNFFPDVLASIVHALDIDLDELPVEDRDRQRLMEFTPAMQAGALHVRDIPIIGAANAAELTVVNDVLEFSSWEEAEKLPYPTAGRRCVAFRVQGRSMEPLIHDGGYAIVDVDEPPVAGKPCVAVSHDGEVYIKVFNQVGNQYYLQAANRDHGEDVTLPVSDRIWVRRVVTRHDPM